MKNNIVLILGILVVAGAAFFVLKSSGKQPPYSVIPTQAPTTSTSPGTTSKTQGSGYTNTKTLTLSISSPSNGATVSSPSVTIKGKTAANAEVFVNDTSTRADASGNFSVTLTLDEGDNPIVVSANDADGNVVEKELTVTYTPAQ